MNLLAIYLISFFSIAHAEIDFDSPFLGSRPAINDLAEKTDLPLKTDIHALIGLQSSVKSQKSRGTCTMFSSMGFIEHLLIKNGLSSSEVDLSEEWMEYIIMTKKTTEGSSISKNFRSIYKNGFVMESTWPYVGKKWTSLEDFPLTRERCGHLSGIELQSCFLGHRDPRLLTMNDQSILSHDAEFLPIKNEGLKNLETVKTLIKKKKSYRLRTLSKVKTLLANGTAVIMGAKLYYGSWNHSKTDKFEIQPRVKSRWYEGIVSYPALGSKDRRISGERGGGHSLIIVGYDDEKIVKSKMMMEDGTWKEFEYKGVYYFKNSWGVRGSGKRFKLDGKSYPGFGMITQKYAHEFGTFFYIETL
ncbi:hypothetical protein A9Q84_13575 [Halobacteriovorax marinus]|uniref:Peptidase C1A papain C-terminal domain-containing protein n=1 Tax=Halobacteriovorax marinus TaxID=97084 RepID=A0A1Y5FEE5_9BACT|nr:hypothetical protein A9Q84_13575 [Halobacteriovorax marinus]